nr:hypothetical protein [uncultured Vibrio sp.]
MNKEQIYDEKISPLMQQIIHICQDNNITMLASFSIPTEESPSLACTTALLSNDSDQLHDIYQKCARMIRNPSTSMLIKISSQESQGK